MQFKQLKKILYRPIVYSKAKKLGNYLLQEIKQSKSILDVGCGDTFVLEYLQDNIKGKITGLDVINISLTDIAPTLYDGRHFPFPNNSFDIVYAIFSLHHCADEEQVLKEMKRVAKKKIIIIEETYQNVIQKYYIFIHDWIANRLESSSINVPFHFRSEDEWKIFFKEFGLRIIRQQSISQFPWYWALALLTFTPQKLIVLEK